MSSKASDNSRAGKQRTPTSIRMEAGNGPGDVVLLKPVVDNLVPLLRATIPSGVNFQFEFANRCWGISADTPDLAYVITKAAIATCDNGEHAGSLIFDAWNIREDLLKESTEGKMKRECVCLEIGFQENGKTESENTKGDRERFARQMKDLSPTIKRLKGAMLVNPNPLFRKSLRFFIPAIPGDETTGIKALSKLSTAERHMLDSELAIDGQTKVPKSTGRTGVTPTLSQKGTVLVVDDDRSVLKALQQILEELEFSVLQAEDGQSGITSYLDNRDAINLVIVDQIMPGKHGCQVLLELKQLNPDLHMILMSGQEPDDATAALIRQYAVPYLRKPFSVNTLLSQVSRLIEDEEDSSGRA